jgi:hypothetical protein
LIWLLAFDLPLMPLAGRWLALGPIPPPIVVDAAAACARGYPIGYRLTMTHGYSSFFVSEPSSPIRISVEAISSVPNASRVGFEFTVSFGVDFVYLLLLRFGFSASTLSDFIDFVFALVTRC